ncbi:glycosyltransferase family 4 protein [Elioraea tepidiphila]|uniref:glycosyltransferase family 4 protein n=1 Tax=Elioraea tepidiphila TaxID=457934 RepID=UPI0003692781|nr:glycosyltransferase [Elioraea tepidiphila]
MRVLYLHQHYSTPEGTLPGRSHAFAAALAARGHDVTLLCGRHEGAEIGSDAAFRRGVRRAEVAGYRVVQRDIPYANAMEARARGRAFLRYASWATRRALFGRFDLVIASSTPLTVALPMIAAKRLRGMRTLFEVRDRWPDLPAAMGLLTRRTEAALARLERAALAAADAVVALAPGTAEALGVACGDPSRVAFIPNGCDRALFADAAAERPVTAPAGGILAVYAGAHGPANGLSQLLDVAWVLKAWKETRVRLVLIGTGAEKPALVARARAEALDNVTFLDPMPRARLAAVLKGADVALHCLAPVPAFADGTSPNKVFEALAAGLPVLTNCPGWLGRELTRARAGMAFSPGHPAPFAEALSVLAAAPERRAAMASAAARLALRFDRTLLAARFCAVAEAAAQRTKLPEGAPLPA